MAVKKEERNTFGVKFEKNATIPVIVQEYESGEVLMLAQMNEEALVKTFETGYAHYYCPEKKAVKKFGEELSNTQKVKTAYLTADSKTLLLKVSQKGVTFPDNATYTAFNNQIKGEYKDIGGEMFGRLQRIVNDCKKNPVEGAYSSFLFARGVDRIGKKVGEEAVEFVIAAKNPEKQGVISEAADLLYHTMVLLSARDVKISEVCSELCKRNR